MFKATFQFLRFLSGGQNKRDLKTRPCKENYAFNVKR